jgi:hypothetical protein
MVSALLRYTSSVLHKITRHALLRKESGVEEN